MISNNNDNRQDLNQTTRENFLKLLTPGACFQSRKQIDDQGSSPRALDTEAEFNYNATMSNLTTMSNVWKLPPRSLNTYKGYE